MTGYVTLMVPGQALDGLCRALGEYKRAGKPAEDDATAEVLLAAQALVLGLRAPFSP